MYRILGSDGNEYGPVSVEQLGQWVRERRVNGETRVQGPDGTWRLLREVPELAGLLQPSAPVQPSAPEPPSLAAPGAEPFVRSEFDGDYDLNLGDCLSSAWTTLWAKLDVIFGPTVLYVLIILAIGFSSGLPYIGPMFTLANLVIGGPLVAGIQVVYLRAIRGEKPTLGSLFDGFGQRFVHLFLGSLAVGILSSLPLLPGLVLSVVSLGMGFFTGLLQGSVTWPAIGILLPGISLFVLGIPIAIYLGLIWMFTLPLILDQRMGFWEAMKRSSRQVRRHGWSCLALLIVLGILNFAGFLCCLVGEIVTWPLSMLASMVAYEMVILGRKTG
jgi:hypothetical protein